MKIYSILLILLLASCKLVTYKILGANRDLKFVSISEYVRYASTHYAIDTTKLYFVAGPSRDTLLETATHSTTDLFIGIFKNDSVQYSKTPWLMDNQSCSGRISNEIALFKKPEHQLVFNDMIRQMQPYNVHTGNGIDFTNGKDKVLLFYSPQFGRFHKKDFKKIQDLVRQYHELELVIISLDDPNTMTR